MEVYIYMASLYILLINLFAFISMYSDKKRAVAGRRRISEARLFLLAIFGGSIGSIIGMYKFRHKTKHLSFRLGMPLILLIQFAAMFLLLLI